MKQYLKSFQKLVESYTPIDSNKLQEEILPLLDCNFINNKDSNLLFYRGLNTSEFWEPLYLIDSTDYDRKPLTGSGLYNLWIDNHSDWKDFSRRSKSLVFSTNYEYAKGFGDRRNSSSTYIILPMRENKYKSIEYSVCPKEDMWVSFDLSKYGVHADINDFFDEIIYLMAELNVLGQTESIDSFERMKDCFIKFDEILKNPTEEQLEIIQSTILFEDEEETKTLRNNFLRSIRKILSPVSFNSKFEILNLEHLTSSKFLNDRKHGQEIWYEGKALAISIATLELFIDDIERASISDVLEAINTFIEIEEETSNELNL